MAKFMRTGDSAAVQIAKNSAIQDNVTILSGNGGSTTIGSDVTIRKPFWFLSQLYFSRAASM